MHILSRIDLYKKYFIINDTEAEGSISRENCFKIHCRKTYGISVNRSDLIFRRVLILILALTHHRIRAYVPHPIHGQRDSRAIF